MSSQCAVVGARGLGSGGSGSGGTVPSPTPGGGGNTGTGGTGGGTGGGVTACSSTGAVYLVAMQVAPGAAHATHQHLLAGDERRAGEAVGGRGDGGTCQ